MSPAARQFIDLLAAEMADELLSQSPEAETAEASRKASAVNSTQPGTGNANISPPITG
jgi:hypothetical protein